MVAETLRRYEALQMNDMQVGFGHWQLDEKVDDAHFRADVDLRAE
jgi:hypothetical protein